MQLFFSKMATKVDRIGPMVNRSEAGEKGERDDDPETFAHHQELRILAQLDLSFRFADWYRLRVKVKIEGFPKVEKENLNREYMLQRKSRRRRT